MKGAWEGRGDNHLYPVALNQNLIESGPDSLKTILPTEIVSKIFSTIPRELATWALVSRSWKVWAYEKSFELRKEEEICDEEQWKKTIGDPGIPPHLPLTLLKDYDKNTHLLTFIPVTIDGRPLTIRNIESLVIHPKNGGYATQYRHIHVNIMEKYGDKPNPKAHWLLLRKALFEGTRVMSYDDQQRMVEAQGWEVPELFGTIVSVFMRYVSKGECVYKEENTRVSASVIYEMDYVQNEYDYVQIEVGFFSAEDGLTVYPSLCDAWPAGMACARKSFEN